jgi:glycosyltransferase involved in cell wall biosynthesis
MNIAWVVPDIPYPLNTGANIAIYNRIFEMRRRGHRIQLFTFATPDEAEMAGLEALRDVCERVVVYPKLGTWRALVKFCLTRTTSLRVLRRPTHQAISDLQGVLGGQAIDILQVESPITTAPCLRHKGRGACALFYDFISLAHEESARIAQHLSLASPMKALCQMESKRAKAATFEMLKRDPFDCYLFVSDTERQTIGKAFPHLGDRLITVPIGLDIDSFSEAVSSAPVSPGKGCSNRLLFFGTFENPANRDGASWFATSILPLILKELPEAMFMVVGKKANRYVGHLRSPNVTVYSDVDDVKSYLAQAAACVLPLRGGGGVRVKLLEAVAARKIVVTTSLGMDGVSFRPGKHLLVADTAEEFAQRCAEVLQNPELFRRMTEDAYTLLRDKHSWSAVGDQLENLYETALKKTQ